MADAVMQKCSGCCAVFSANGDGSYKYAIGEQNGDLRQFTKEMNAKLNGRGAVSHSLYRDLSRHQKMKSVSSSNSDLR